MFHDPTTFHYLLWQTREMEEEAHRRAQRAPRREQRPSRLRALLGRGWGKAPVPEVCAEAFARVPH